MDPSRLEAEHVSSDPEEYADQLKQRLESENRRYKKLYGINPLQLDNYDLVVDTSGVTPEHVAEQIIAHFRQWRNS
jgi:cytidylate kinase